MLPWITIDFFAIFGGVFVFALFMDDMVAALAPVFTREREEDEDE